MTEELFKAKNDIFKLEELLKLEKEKLERYQNTSSALSHNDGFYLQSAHSRVKCFKNLLFKLHLKFTFYRAKYEKEEFLKNQNTVEGTLAEYKDEVYKLKDQLKVCQIQFYSGGCRAKCVRSYD